MKIGMMARSLRRPVTGIGRYTHALASAVSEQVGPQNFTLFLTREAAATGISAQQVVCPVPTPHESLRALWEHTFVPLEVKRRAIDVYHSPNYTLPLNLPCAGVVTVHDLAFMEPNFHKTRLRLYLRLLTGISLRRAAKIIAVSEYTKHQIEQRFPRVRGRVSVVYSGLQPRFLAPQDSGHRLHLRPYVLFVGSVEPRKNLPRLVRAWERAVTANNLPHDLVLCGPIGWRYDASLNAIQNSPLRERIHQVGFVPETDLPHWYAGADLLLYPSLDEGFGFPVLEAMAAGTPVVSSDCSAIPEVAGDAAVLVNPKSVNAIADAITSVLTDQRLASDLIDRGRERASRFTWESAALETLAVYRLADRG
jgi:glycosyltransferase involved in cell wall biosynthesis